MRRRLFKALGVAAVLAALGIFLRLAPVPVAGQAPAARPTTGTPAATRAAVPKTAWGHPNLQGIWLDEFNTPLERPAQYANQEFFTDAERKAQDEARSKDIGADLRGTRGTEPDLLGAYNAVFQSMKRTGRRTSMVVDPPNGRIPATTARVQEQNRIEREFRLALLQNTNTCQNARRGCNGGKYGPPSPRRNEVAPFYNVVHLNRNDGPEDQTLGDRCMGGSEPNFNAFRRIVQGPDSLAIGVDTGQGQGFQRIVYLSGSHPPSHVRLRHGDSRGRFEGNALVVETTNFSPLWPFRGAAEHLTLVERYTRIDANTLEFAVTVTDPTVWTAPWTAKQELTMQSDQQNRIYYEPRCHEGNYGLPAILIGARMVDKAFAEGRGPNPASIDIATQDTTP